MAAGTLADDEPDLAWLHARAARSKGGRIAVVRETVGLVAYRAGQWSEAIAELRAARRMGGGPGHLAVLADCERALEHPERAIEIGRSAEADGLDAAAAIELKIVVAGARADLGQLDAALVMLEAAGATSDAVEPWTPRLQYAYADLLATAGRQDEALNWFMRAYDSDTDEETDAADRIAELAGGEIGAVESDESDEPDLSGGDPPDAGDLALTTDDVDETQEAIDPGEQLEPDADEPAVGASGDRGDVVVAAAEPGPDGPNADGVNDDGLNADEPNADGPNGDGPATSGLDDAPDDWSTPIPDPSSLFSHPDQPVQTSRPAGDTGSAFDGAGSADEGGQ